jgi:Domain of unknown function (DUF2017)
VSGSGQRGGDPDGFDEVTGPDYGSDHPGDLYDMAAEEVVEVTMAGFRRTAGGVSARFSAAEAGVVRTLVSQVAELLGGDPAASPLGPGGLGGGDLPGWGPPAQSPSGPETPGSGGGGADQGIWTDEDLEAMIGSGGPAEPPDDPAIARLLPSGYTDDPEAAAEFRQYTEPGLRSGKVAAARTVLETLPGGGGRVRLRRQEAEVWLRALNDVRLALGVRLGITEDYEAELAADSGTDPRSAYLQVYDWLSFLQESLVRALW